MARLKRESVGFIGVDSGSVLLGDPCYWLSRPDYLRLIDGEHGVITFDNGVGKGVWSDTGYGDGEYEVFVTKNRHGRTVKLEAVFIERGDQFDAIDDEAAKEYTLRRTNEYLAPINRYNQKAAIRDARDLTIGILYVIANRKSK